MPQDVSSNETEITLGLLAAVDNNSDLTQRTVARELGIALGLANAYLKRCVKKGFIKVRQIPRNRYAYYLTAHGFAEKSRLTAEYLGQSFNLFRVARRQYGDLLANCAARGWHRVALLGASDLAEIVILCASDVSIRIVGVVDEHPPENPLMGLPVVGIISALPAIDAVIVTDLKDPQTVFDDAVALLPPGTVLAPRMLNVSPRRTPETPEQRP